MTVTLLSPVQDRALESLATYRFLTIELMQRVGIGRDPKNLRSALDTLVGRGWVGRTKEVPFMPGVGRLPHLYWLRQAGAEILAELRGIEPPPAVKGMVTAVMELPHRLAIIESHIALRQWADGAGAVVDWFKADYEPGADRLQKATTLPYPHGRYTPDALAQVTLADGKARLLVFEVYRGGRDGSLDHFRRKLPELREVSEEQAVEQYHQAPRAARFLILFTDEAMRAAALQRWTDPPRRFGRGFSSRRCRKWQISSTSGGNQAPTVGPCSDPFSQPSASDPVFSYRSDAGRGRRAAYDLPAWPNQ